MSLPMDFKEFAALLRITQAEHCPMKPKPVRTYRQVKYMYPSIDMRTSTVFAIRIKSFGGEEVVLHCQNEARHIQESLFERCLSFLKGGPIEEGSRVSQPGG